MTGPDRPAGHVARCGRGTRSPRCRGLFEAECSRRRSRSRRATGSPGRGQEPRSRRPTASSREVGRAPAPPGPDVADPDWFHDPVPAGERRDAAYAFAVDHRDETVTGKRQVGGGALPSPPPHRAGGRRWPRRTPGMPRPSPPSCGRGGPPTRSSAGSTGPTVSSSVSGSPARVGSPAPGCLAGGGHLFEDNPMALVQNQVAPGIPCRVPQPGLIGEQPRRRRGGGTARRGLCLPLVRGERRVASRRGPRAAPRARGEHLPERGEPGAGAATTTGSSPSWAWSPSSRRRSRGIPCPARSVRCWSARSTRRRRCSTGPAARRDRVAATRAGRSSSTTRTRPVGRPARLWRRDRRRVRLVAADRGLRRRCRARLAGHRCSCQCAALSAPTVVRRRRPAHPREPAPREESRSCGAAATAGLRGSCRSPRTATPTPSR